MTLPKLHQATSATALIITLVYCPVLHAAIERHDAAAAEALFQEALKLMEANRLSEACPRLEESQRLDPGVGTLMYLALCYERTGRNASAWSTYREAEASASSASQADRARIAKDRADVLEPKLSRLVLRVTGDAVPGLVVTRDGVELGLASVGLAVPVDPGKHQVNATAPNRKPYAVTVDVPPGSGKVVLDLPPLEPVAAISTSRTGVSPLKRERGSPTRDRGGAWALGVQHWMGLGVGAIGVAGLGLGTYYGLKSKSYESQAEEHRESGTNGYRGEGYTLNEKALDNRERALLSFAVGGAAVVSGAVLFLTAPRARPQSAELRLRTAVSGSSVSLTLEGGWQ